MRRDRGFGVGLLLYAIGSGALTVLITHLMTNHVAKKPLHSDQRLFDYVGNPRNLDGEDIRLLKTRLRLGGDPNTLNEKAQTPIQVALSHRDPSLRIVLVFLKFGADPNFPDPDGNTSLHLAARFKDPSLMRALLKAGGDPFITTRGQTEHPYALAVRLANVNVVSAIERSKKFRKFKKGQKRQ